MLGIKIVDLLCSRLSASTRIRLQYNIHHKICITRLQFIPRKCRLETLNPKMREANPTQKDLKVTMTTPFNTARMAVPIPVPEDIKRAILLQALQELTHQLFPTSSQLSTKPGRVASAKDGLRLATALSNNLPLSIHLLMTSSNLEVLSKGGGNKRKSSGRITEEPDGIQNVRFLSGG